MCGSTPESDLGVTNCQFSVQSVCALDLGSLQARGLYIFLAVYIATTRWHLAHRQKNTASLGVQCLEGDGWQ